jgi:hypothetical protein
VRIIVLNVRVSVSTSRLDPVTARSSSNERESVISASERESRSIGLDNVRAVHTLASAAMANAAAASHGITLIAPLTTGPTAASIESSV